MNVLLESNLGIAENPRNSFTLNLPGKFELERHAGLLKGFLFPDSAVYYEDGFSTEKSQGKIILIEGRNRIRIAEDDPVKKRKILEVAVAHICVLFNILQFGTPKFLGREKVSELTQMKSEKARRETR